MTIPSLAGPRFTYGTSAPSFESVTVAIPTLNRPDDLDIVVAGLIAQTILPLQLIIVDQSAGSESLSRVNRRIELAGECVQRSLELTYIHDAKITGLTAARNRALEVVRGKVVLFLDDDVVLEADFLEEILKTYRRFPKATGVSGIVTNYSPPSGLYKYWSTLFAVGPCHDDRQPIYWRAAKLGSTEPVRVTRLGGGLMSFRVDAIRGLRFDENLTGACDAEDVDFTVRLGSDALLLVAPTARLVHKASPVARQNTHWLYKHARAMWYLYRRNWRRSLAGSLCFGWLNVGYLFACSIIALVRLSPSPWQGYLRSIRESRTLVPGG